MTISGFEQVDTTHYAPEQAVYSVSVRQTPAFLMMVLADLVASDCHINLGTPTDKKVKYSNRGKGEDNMFFTSTGFYVAKRYEGAKKQFATSAGEQKNRLARFFHVGGVIDSHMAGTYYFLSNDYRNVLELDNENSRYRGVRS